MPQMMSHRRSATLTLSALLFFCALHATPVGADYSTAGPKVVARSPAAGTLFLYPERVPLRAGGYAEADRGMMFVPLKRSDPKSRVIAVEVYRFRGSNEEARRRPPVFRLFGGPGFPGLSESLEKPGVYEENFLPALQISDLVVVGQRGIGSSKPHTVCESPSSDPLDAEVSDEEIAAALQESCAKGRRYWESRGYDLTGFNVIEAAADVHDVAKALGYDRITLWGGSFGSHWAMTVMRYHPRIVARAILSGMEGPDHTYDMPSGVLNSLRRIAAEAEKSPRLKELIPEGGLIEAFKRVIARVEEEPVKVTVPHPESGVATTVRFGADDVRGMALGYTARAASRSGIRTWPSDVLTLCSGDFTNAATSRIRRRDADRVLTASYFMLDCGSGISPERESRLNADPAAAVVGHLGGFYQTCCPMWGSDLGNDFRKNFQTEIPTLIVHGNWDVSTPLENALELAPHFKNSKLVIVNRGSHGALSEAMIESPRFREAVLEFARSGDLSGVPGEVELSPIHWKVPDLKASE